MSGIMKIRDDAKWMPAGWVFDRVVERIATELENTNRDLSITLLDTMTTNGMGYCDISSLNSEEFLVVVEAIKRAYEKSKVEGAQSFYNPQYYPPFLSAFGELKDLILSDRRSHFLRSPTES
jgi:hypothetical protein